MRRPNFWKLMAKFPPVLVRLLARRRTGGKHVVALSSEEIAIASGLTLERVREIQLSENWNEITLKEAELFCLGCRFDPCNFADRNRYRAYTNQCKNNPTKNWWKYLRTSPHWGSEFVPLVQTWKRLQPSLTGSSHTKSTQANSPVKNSSKHV